MIRRHSSAESGQVLIIFAFAFVAIIIMLALLFDGARGLVLRRQMQDASDAAAIAAANVIQGLTTRGCSTTPGPPPGAPQAAVVAAAKASVAANLPNYPQADVVVTCVADAVWKNFAVEVTLSGTSPTFFGSVMGGGPLTVGTDSAAVNGDAAGNQYSVVLLDPSNLSWPQGDRGCPSFLLSGGPTVQFDSAIYVDSSCSAANGGAMATNGNAASLTQGPGAIIRLVGEYKPQALTITPAPLEHQAVKLDPLACCRHLRSARSRSSPTTSSSSGRETAARPASWSRVSTRAGSSFATSRLRISARGSTSSTAGSSTSVRDRRSMRSRGT
jgi:hypothetical protein